MKRATASPLRLSDFSYDLPENLIALRPAEPRSAARLLHLHRLGLDDRRVGDLPDLLRPNDLLIVNDTKVIPARLFGLRTRVEAEARIEATLIERLEPARWLALAKPGKRLRIGDRIAFSRDGAMTTLLAEVAEKRDGGAIALSFDRSGPDLDAVIANLGAMPLPPYIAARRAADARDDADYQPIFARRTGAVAAPTASLHFDETLLARLDERGVARATVTLHVGAGTFLPVTTDDPRAHTMHAEWGEVSSAAAERIRSTRADGGRIVAVGTTALRILETAAIETGEVREWRGDTDLFIMPGFEFRAVDALLTNFHLPGSTLLMLIAAFVGRGRVLAAYDHAVRGGYRFYSYGDATFLERSAATGEV